MSVSTTTLKRLPTIKQGLIDGLTREQIGAKCSVTEKTIRRDIHSWIESGFFETWLKEEFLRLHVNIIHEDPTEAYRQISKLVGRTLIHRIEQQVEIDKRETVNINVTENEDEILSKAARILTRKRKFERIH